MVDDEGRVFGRVNLVDAIALVVLLAILPAAYGAALLSRPSRPAIASVTPAPIGNEERRLTRGTLLGAKLKVRGNGFNPMLRAAIGDTPALAFVFEHPNSADVLVGPVPPGSHDLVLFDGVQEVARARGAVVIEAANLESVRASGWLTMLDRSVAGGLKPGMKFPADDFAFEIIALGPTVPARLRISLAGRETDLPQDARFERRAVVTLRCDPPTADGGCAVGGAPLRGAGPLPVELPSPRGSLRFVVEEIAPTTPPVRGRVSLALDDPDAPVQANNRDAWLDERAAVIGSVTRAGGTTRISLELGMDESREGWRYRGALLKPGRNLVFATDRYEVTGRILSVAVADGAAAKP